MRNDGNIRLPPGQHLTQSFPVLDLGVVPNIDIQHWCLRVFGEVEQVIELNWQAFSALPQTQFKADFHCVTTWSRFDLSWEGVLVRELIALVKPLSTAHFVLIHCHDNYTTNLALEVFLDDDVIIATGLDGGPLLPEHGGPARLVVPKRYGWKSAKWVKAIEFIDHDQSGYWEIRGYHNEANPWQEQRYSEK